MINKLMKALVDFIYGTSRFRKKYQQFNPTDKVLAGDASKTIITDQDEDVTKGVNWVKAKRAVLLLTESKIICGNWEIPIEEIKSAQLLKLSSLLADGMVLKIQTLEDINYQFGMQLNPEWMNQKILPLKLEKTKIKYSIYSIVVRIIAVGYLLYSRFAKETLSLN